MKKVFLGLFALVGSFVAVVAIQANTGWLWGGSDDGAVPANSTGVGWISLSSKNCDTNDDGQITAADTAPAGCPALGTMVAKYEVVVPNADGDLSGYAWSPNLGYISFNQADVVGCPGGSCKAYREGNNLKGWARIVDIKTEYEKVPSNSGGWQGFISLSSLNVGGGANYGVTIDGAGKLNNYGWSGELGWINFNSNLGTATVAAAVSGSGKVTSSPAGIDTQTGNNTFAFTLGENVSLTATPAVGSVFVNWSGDCGGTTSPCNLGSVNSPKSVTANFALACTNECTIAASQMCQGTSCNLCDPTHTYVTGVQTGTAVCGGTGIGGYQEVGP